MLCDSGHCTRDEWIESTTFTAPYVSCEGIARTPLSRRSDKEPVCCIAEYRNRFYGSTYDSNEDLRQRWYTREEIGQFRRVTRDKTDSIASRSSEDPTHLKWFFGLLEACIRIRNDAITRAFIDRIVQLCRISEDDPDLVGLEKIVFRPLFDKDRLTRKQIMMYQICYSSPSLVRFHGRTSREASRSDRSLAYLIARMHAESLKT